MALPNNRLLTLADVDENFNEYNFLIFTNSGTIDTSNYTKKDHEGTKTLQGVTNVGDYVLYLYNAEGDYPVNLGGTHHIKTQCHKLVNEFKYVAIPSASVQRVQIKSKRNFLLNQKPIK